MSTMQVFQAKCRVFQPLLWVLWSLSVFWIPSAWALDSLDSFPKATLSIRTGAGTQHFNIWIADNERHQEQGLMYVKALNPNQGMLFPQEQPRVVTMWMKNTLIPLDMVFIDASGRIVYIKQNATPESEAIITTPTPVPFNTSEPVPVKAVLELAGGECSKRHIQAGDRVVMPMFSGAKTGQVPASR